MRIAAGCIAVLFWLGAAPVHAQTAAPAPKLYSLDDIALGSNVDDLVRIKGAPQANVTSAFLWRNSAGGTLEVMFSASRTITRIDVTAGKHEVREIHLPGAAPNWSATLGATGHMNYDQPPEASFDTLCGSYRGEPCESFTLPGDVALIVNFGQDSGLADWFLSEVVLGYRSSMGS